MKLPALLTAIGITLTASSSEVQFTGSYWERGDAFRLSIELDENTGSLTWDGVPLLPVNPEIEQDRNQLSIQLTEEEASLLGDLVSNLPLCHSGPHMAIGTGLSVRMSITQNSKDPVEFGYFGMSQGQILGARAEQFPISLMALMSDGELTPDERDNFFNETKAFATLLATYRTTLDNLDQSFQSQQDPDWQTLRKNLLKDFIRSPEDDEYYDVIATSNEAALILDVISEPENASLFTNEKNLTHLVFTIDELVRSDSEFYGRFLPAPDLTSSTGRWAFLPQEFRSLVQDFIEPNTTKEFSNYYEHPIFKIPLKSSRLTTKTVKDRITFIDQSTLLPSLFEETASQDSITPIGIIEMEFSNRLSRCLVKTSRDDEIRVTLFEVKEGHWTLLRQVDYDVWENYGWEKPAPSPWK